jgi:hypothetical protein
VERRKELLVTFRLDADEYQDLGEDMMPMARQDAWELIFKRAELNVLETMMHAAVKPSGNDTMDRLFRDCLEKELEAIRAAALTATYEIIDAVGES